MSIHCFLMTQPLSHLRVFCLFGYYRNITECPRVVTRSPRFSRSVPLLKSCRHMLQNEDLTLPVTSFLTKSIAGLDLNGPC